MKRTIGLILSFLFCGKAVAATCASFCGVPTFFSDMHIASSSQVPGTVGEGKTIGEAFDTIGKNCTKLNAKWVPLRFLDAPAGVQNSLRVVLVPAIPKDVCL